MEMGISDVSANGECNRYTHFQWGHAFITLLEKLLGKTWSSSWIARSSLWQVCATENEETAWLIWRSLLLIWFMILLCCSSSREWPNIGQRQLLNLKRARNLNWMQCRMQNRITVNSLVWCGWMLVIFCMRGSNRVLLSSVNQRKALRWLWLSWVTGDD